MQFYTKEGFPYGRTPGWKQGVHTGFEDRAGKNTSLIATRVLKVDTYHLTVLEVRYFYLYVTINFALINKILCKQYAINELPW